MTITKQRENCTLCITTPLIEVHCAQHSHWSANYANRVTEHADRLALRMERDTMDFTGLEF